MSLRRPVTGLLRCKGAVASFTTPKFSLARSPEVSDGCKFRSCACTSICNCLMSLTWACELPVAVRSWDPGGGAGARTMSLRSPDLLACCGVCATWSERCNGVWTMSLRRPVTGLLRCKGAVASFATPKFLGGRSRSS